MSLFDFAGRNILAAAPAATCVDAECLAVTNERKIGFRDVHLCKNGEDSPTVYWQFQKKLKLSQRLRSRGAVVRLEQFE